MSRRIPAKEVFSLKPGDIALYLSGRRRRIACLSQCGSEHVFFLMRDSRVNAKIPGELRRIRLSDGPIEIPVFGDTFIGILRR
jgi:hypothetical protein